MMFKRLREARKFLGLNQTEFAEKISAIDKQKELIKQSLAEVEDLFNSRMDYYFH